MTRTWAWRLVAVASSALVLGGCSASFATEWAVTMSGPSNEDEIDGVAASPDGSLFVTGKFEQSTTLGGTALASAGRADMPVARFDASGQPLWVQRFGGPGEDNFFDIDADADGAIASGWFEGTVDFGGVTLTSAGASDCVVVAFDNDGGVRWARAIGGPRREGCNEIVIAADGSIVTSLDTDGGWDSPVGPIPELPAADTLLTRLDPVGNIAWMRHVGGARAQRGKSIAVAVDGSVAFGGDSIGGLTIDGMPVAVSGQGRDAWFSYWSADGQLAWWKTWGGPGDDIVKGLAFGGDSVFAVGAFTGTIDVDGTTLDAGADNDLAVVRFAPSGLLAWATSVSADDPLSDIEVVAAPDGGVVFGSVSAAGTSFRSPTAPATPLDDSDGGVAWLAHYRPDGSVAFAKTIAGTTIARPGEIARSGNRVYLDVVLRGADNIVNGHPFPTQGKDGSVWALDLEG